VTAYDERGLILKNSLDAYSLSVDAVVEKIMNAAAHGPGR
jgi:hypothetical protein